MTFWTIAWGWMALCFAYLAIANAERRQVWQGLTCIAASTAALALALVACGG